MPTSLTIPLVTTPTPFTTIGRYDNALAGATGQNTGQDIFQIFDTRGQIVTHMNSDGSIDPPLFPQNVIANITSAQLLALHTTPALILASPAPNAIIIPQVVSVMYFAGGPAYTVTGGDSFLYIGWGSAPTTNFAIDNFEDSPLNSTSSSFQSQAILTGVSVPLSAIQGQSVFLGIKDTLTLGNGTLSIAMSYQIVGTQ